MLRKTIWAGVASLVMFGSQAFAAPDFERSVRDFKQTLKSLVKANTSNPPGNEAKAVEIFAARLKAEGIPYQTVEFAPGRSNIVARLKGNGKKKPILLLAHTDVVGTENQAWTVPPHEVTEKDGYLYGRGVLDDLGMATANLETFLSLKRQGITLERDVILALTGDEESGGAGIQFLLQKHPEWIDAEIGLNEGGFIGKNEAGEVRFLNLGAAEKTYMDFSLTVKGPTGHSSVPRPGNAIFRLATALDRLGKHRETERLLPATREYFKKRALVEPPDVAKAMMALADAKGALPKKALEVLKQNPLIGPLLATTCVATLVSGGIRANSLPPDATATVNCRIMPDEPVTNVQRRLQEIIGDSEVVVAVKKDMGVGGMSTVAGVVPETVRKLAKEFFPKAPVIIAMGTGATDSRYLRQRGMQVYGLNPLAIFEGDITRAHGIDERIPESSIRPGLEFQYRLVMELAAAEPSK